MAGLSSMTGFARTDASNDIASWTWELKSVNGRNLDIRIRMPHGFDQLDPLIRKAVSGALSRGSVSVGLTVRDDLPGSRVVVNSEVLDLVLGTIDDIRDRLETAAPRPEGILALRGVLEQADDSHAGDRIEGLREDLTKSFHDALAGLVNTRDNEGELLRPVLHGHLERIGELAIRAGEVPGHQPEALRARLNSQIEAVMEDHRAIDPVRLNQELALLVTKADVREEIDRLKAHCRTAAEMIAAGGPVGRRLDHLCQEFNREANTLCSKSNDVEMTAIGLDLKAVIDQFREQVQNLE